MNSVFQFHHFRTFTQKMPWQNSTKKALFTRTTIMCNRLSSRWSSEQNNLTFFRASLKPFPPFHNLQFLSPRLYFISQNKFIILILTVTWVSYKHGIWWKFLEKYLSFSIDRFVTHPSFLFHMWLFTRCIILFVLTRYPRKEVFTYSRVKYAF